MFSFYCCYVNKFTLKKRKDEWKKLNLVSFCIFIIVTLALIYELRLNLILKKIGAQK